VLFAVKEFQEQLGPALIDVGVLPHRAVRGGLWPALPATGWSGAAIRYDGGRGAPGGRFFAFDFTEVEVRGAAPGGLHKPALSDVAGEGARGARLRTGFQLRITR
jgi:hypothetical protein